MRLLRLLPFLLLSLLLASPAHAASPPLAWGPPTPVPGLNSGPLLAVNSSGRGLLLGYGPSSQQPGQSGALASVFSPDGTFSPVKQVTPSLYLTDRFSFYAADHILASGVVNSSSGRVWYGTGRVGGSLSTRFIPDAWYARTTRTAATPQGDLAVLSLACPTNKACTGNLRLTLSVRRAGHSWQQLRLDEGRLTTPIDLSSNPRGDLLFAYAKRDSLGRQHLYSRVRTLGGTMQARQDLGFSGYAGSVSASLGPARRAAVIWLSQTVSECQPSGPASVQAAVAGPGGVFAKTRLLASWNETRCGHYVASPGVKAGFSQDAGRHALLSWTSKSSDGTFSVFSALLSGTHWGASHRLSSLGVQSTLADMDVTPAGEAAVAFTTGQAGADPVPGAHQQLMVASTPALDQPLGEALPATPAGDEQYIISGVALAIDPLSTRALLAYRPVVINGNVLTQVSTQVHPV